MNPKYVFTEIRNEIVVKDLVTIYYFEFGPTLRFDGESHDFWELMYIDHGELTVKNEDSEFKMTKGQVVLYPPNYFHGHYANNSEPVNMVIITFTSPSEKLYDICKRPLNLSSSNVKLINNIITEASGAFSSRLDFFVSCELVRRIEQPFGAEQLIRLNLETLLINMYRQTAETKVLQIHKAEKTYSDQRIEPILNYLRDNIYKKITMKDICDYFSLSPTCIKTMFRNINETSIMKYYTNLRIEEAKRLLRKGTYTVSEIAEMLSYSSIQHFSKQFRSITGYTPSDYITIIKSHID